jgi:uncharacterized protein
LNYKGKTALITGASSGIGAEFAKVLASQHVNLVLVARSNARLQTLATTLRQQYGIRAEVITSDLSREGAAQQIIQEVEQRQLRIDILINNAAFGLYEHFENILAERDHEQLMVNVVAVVDLSHAFIPFMLKRPQETAIINVASMAAFQATPYMAVYAASKAFIISFSLALAEEYRQRGLQVLTLVPGATDTAFYETSGEIAGATQKRTSAQVVTTGLKALERGQTFVIDGYSNRFAAALSRLVSRQAAARLIGQLIRPRENKAS